ncbi:MAG TPA: hypothetical protein VF704_08975 [Allosphingosinicella sp.]|jgi:hypothetical protein
MPTGNTLHIRNQLPEPITVYVSPNGWNCCDAPAQNQAVAYIQPSANADLAYSRTGGHGCDGNQGQFQLACNISMLVNLNFDADGNMAPADASGCEAAVSQDSDGTFSLIIYN